MKINVGFFSLLGILFIGLKLSNQIDWSWFWVLMPIAFPFYVFIFLALIFIIASAIDRL